MHDMEEVCPLCEQLIPHDQSDEIKERIEARQKKNEAEVSNRLQIQFATEKTALLEQASKDADAKVVQAREQAEKAGLEKIEAAQVASRLVLEGLQKQVDDVTAAKTAAEELQRGVQAELAQAKVDSQAAIDVVKQDALAREAQIRAEAKVTADAAAKDQLATAEASKVQAEEAGKALKDQLEKLTVDTDAKILAVNEAAAVREAKIKEEAAAAAKQKLSEIEEARAAAEAKAIEAERLLADVKAAEETRVAARLQEQREILEQAKQEAVNEEKATAFKETQKLSLKVAELTRALEKKSNEELGEGAEIKLLEALKAEFENDKFEPINRGQPGADILHTVIHNGKACGTIIYDSKNHGAWRNDFVTKLASDQMAAKAEHAILATSVFPAGVHQLHQQDGVLIANPARIVALVSVVRQHIVQTHSLRVSGEERVEKTAALYDFITSERCNDLLNRINVHTDDLLDIQVKEKKAHDAVWKRQGELIRNVQKTRSELTREIDDIIGTGEPGEGRDE